MSRDPACLLDTLVSAKMILEYAGDTDRQSFERNSILQDAIIRRLTLIGEATKRRTDEFRLSHPEIPWKQIAGMRDIVAHNYDQVQIEKIWEVILQDIPGLITQIEHFVPPENTDMSSKEG